MFLSMNTCELHELCTLPNVTAIREGLWHLQNCQSLVSMFNTRMRTECFKYIMWPLTEGPDFEDSQTKWISHLYPSLTP